MEIADGNAEEEKTLSISPEKQLTLSKRTSSFIESQNLSSNKAALSSKDEGFNDASEFGKE